MSATKGHHIKDEDMQDDMAEADEEDDDEDEETYGKRSLT